MADVLSEAAALSRYNGGDRTMWELWNNPNRQEIINRLKNINIANKDLKKTVIHLDLYDSKQTDLMKDFLYSFLITKLYGQSENLFYLSKEVEIKIEISN